VKNNPQLKHKTKTPSQSRTPTKVRQDLIKGGLLLIVFLVELEN